MAANVSVRLDDRLAERLRLRARASYETLSERLGPVKDAAAAGIQPLIAAILAVENEQLDQPVLYLKRPDAGK